MHCELFGAVAELAEKLDLPIEGPHTDDQFWIDMLPQQAQMMGFQPSRPFTPNRWLEDGDTVTVGETIFQVRHCPGHTPGHVVFYQPDSKLVVVGDVLFNGSIGRTDFPKGDFDTLIQAIKDKLLTLDDDVSFIPGHGPMSTIGHERANNPFVSGKHG